MTKTNLVMSLLALLPLAGCYSPTSDRYSDYDRFGYHDDGVRDGPDVDRTTRYYDRYGYRDAHGYHYYNDQDR